MAKGFVKDFFKDSMIYVVPTILTYGLNIFLVPLYTRVLSPSDYGAIDMLKVFASIAYIVVALEISQAMVRFYVDQESTEDKIRVSSTALWHTIISFILFYLICFIFSKPLTMLLFDNIKYKNVFLLGSAFIVLNAIALLTFIQFRYELKSIQYLIGSVINFIATSGFSLFFAYILKWGLIGMVFALFLGSTVGLTYNLWKLKTSFSFIYDFKLLKPMIQFSYPLIFSGIAVFIGGSFDRIIIRHYLSLNEVGLYGIGFRIASIISILLVGCNSSLTPLIYSHYKEENTPGKIVDVFRYFIASSLFFYCGITAFSNEILSLMTTPDYYAGGVVVIYLVPAILFSQLYIFAPGTAIAKKTKIIMGLNIITAIIYIALGLIFIPWLGYVGAAIGSMLSHGISFTLKMKVSQYYYRLPFRWKPIISSVVITLLLLVIIKNINISDSINIFCKIILLTIIPFTFLLSGLIKKNEMQYLSGKISDLVSCYYKK